MKILGIDPGTATLGYGILENSQHVLHGIISTKKGLKPEIRLLKIYEELLELIDEHMPDEIAVESLFFFKNSKTVISVGEARGVVLLASAKRGIPVYSYTPLQVKQGITTYGRASKKEIQDMVKILLELDKIPKPDDAADALAIAITHSNFVDNRVDLEIEE